MERRGQRSPARLHSRPRPLFRRSDSIRNLDCAWKTASRPSGGMGWARWDTKAGAPLFQVQVQSSLPIAPPHLPPEAGEPGCIELAPPKGALSYWWYILCTVTVYLPSLPTSVIGDGMDGWMGTDRTSTDTIHLRTRSGWFLSNHGRGAARIAIQLLDHRIVIFSRMGSPVVPDSRILTAGLVCLHTLLIYSSFCLFVQGSYTTLCRLKLP